ncbi:hypothetical protein BJ166DRAFT_295511 [Pestalotiopsis sp. NC0098]|nr:hypothetical protein BJ166DRAFT_295511 [Pestalotiopsis sp. NC0098]
MCYQLVEVYSACRCLYYRHAADKCASYGRPGHSIAKRTILVGYACLEHSTTKASEVKPFERPAAAKDSAFLMAYLDRATNMQ